MAAFLSLLYGIACYLAFLATFLYAIAFVGNIGVPRSIDLGPAAPVGEALVINLALLALFAVQHSIMARRGFKKWWTRFVPWSVERSTFVLAATAALALLLWQWRPITEPVLWRVDDTVGASILMAVFWLGWAMLLASTFLINHFELFGLQQVWTRFRGREMQPPQFRTPLFYRYVRHPIYVGFLLAFWATPVMTAGHLLFAVATTGYILIGVWFEERDLVAYYGGRYRAYQKQVGMLFPRLRGKGGAIAEEDQANVR